MSAHEREIVVDIGGGMGEGLVKQAMQSPDTEFYVIDPELKGAEPQVGNLHFIDRLVDFDAQLPFPRRSVSRVNLNFLMGEVRSSCVDTNRADEKAMYGMILDEAVRVLKEDGVIEITEVRGNYYPVREMLNQRCYFEDKQPVIAQRGATKYADYFFDHFDHSGLKPTESMTLPIRFEARKDHVLEQMRQKRSL